LTRRKQVITNDVLGRMIKAETFNWDGATVYSTVTSMYNALDQVTLTKQYAGSTSSSTFQESSVEYDGYGRVYRTHAPEQFTIGLGSSEVPTYTTFTYNADDTRATITDGRGATTAFTYNNRHLVTQVDYSVSGGSITVPDDTVFTYDGAGNRTSMTDGSGNTDYVYDQQSRLTQETRYFDLTLAAAPESGNGFKLEYTYGLDGSLATLTDPFSHTFTYARDNLGRLTGVTGTSFAGITTYASNAGYRAWDAPKALDYGNGLSMSMTFNERQQAATFEVGKTGSTLIQKSYQYYNDGKLKFSDDSLDAKFDRLQKYDSVGRIEEAFSGARARGETLDDYANQPYQEFYGYNAFDQITSRENRHWVAEYGTSDSYDRNRRAACDYDADGRLTRMGSTTDGDEVSYLIDAAGQIEQDTATGQDRSNMSYDGDGQMTVQTKYHWLTATSVFNTVPTSDNLFIRSSVLNGTVVSEALGASSGSDAGKMWRTHIPAGGTELAQLIKGGGFLSDAVYWPITDPAQESYRLTDASGGVAGSYLFPESAKEMDPAGADVKPWNPYDTINPPLEGFPDSSTLTPFAASPAFPHVTVSFNGIPISRDQLYFFLESGHLGGQLGLLELSVRPKFDHWAVRTEFGEVAFHGTLEGAVRDVDAFWRHMGGDIVRYWTDTSWAFSANLFPSALSTQQGQRPSIPVAQTAGKREPLARHDQKTYDSQRAKVLKSGIPEPCAQFLREHGIDPADVLLAIRAQQPFSGTASTISRGEAGDIDFDDGWNGISSVNQEAIKNQALTKEFNNSGLVASTGIYPGGQPGATIADRSTIYFSGGGLKAIFLLHEAIHSVTGVGDRRLAIQLGIGGGGLASERITAALKAHGCRW
jgi:YD repeat-containing protein